jgi:MFS family permease
MSATQPLSGGLPSATYVLSACQALNLTAAVISVTIAPLVGAKLAPGAAWATVPYGFQFAAVMLATYPAAALMRRFGRKPCFMVAAIILILAGWIGFDAVNRNAFAEMIVAHGLLGAYVAFANYYRFAAVDRVPDLLRARAMSIVVGGGIVAALAGPLISMGLKEVHGYASFSLCYAALSALGILTVVLLYMWKPEPDGTAAESRSERAPLAARAPVIAAVFASASGYFVMNLLMVQASLVMASMCVSFNASSMAVQAHVVAMFAPSLVAGRVIARLGHRAALLCGFALLAAAALAGAANYSYPGMMVGLLLLGVGWNLSYVGGGALLAQCLSAGNRHRLQGMNDTVIALCATLGAFSPALLQATIGWSNTNLLCLVICAAGCVLTWCALRARPAGQALTP